MSKPQDLRPVYLTAKELQTVCAAMAGNHPPSLHEYRVPVLRKLARAALDAGDLRSAGEKEDRP